MKLKKLLLEGTVSTMTLSSEVDKYMDRIAKISNLGEDYDTIQLAETIVDYLERKHIRYKSTKI